MKVAMNLPVLSAAFKQWVILQRTLGVTLYSFCALPSRRFHPGGRKTETLRAPLLIRGYPPLSNPETQPPTSITTHQSTNRFSILSRDSNDCRLLDTSSTDCQTDKNYVTDRALLRDRNRRLPLHMREEIEEVLAEFEAVIQEFAGVMGCSVRDMRNMVRRDTRLVTACSKEDIMAKMTLLKNFGFSTPTIMGRYQLFQRSRFLLERRLELLRPLKHYRCSLAPLGCTEDDFREYLAKYQQEAAVMGNHTCQASFVAELLETTQENVEAMSAKFHFLSTLAPSRLKKLVDILHSFGISSSRIRRGQGPLMLKCVPEVAERHLRQVKEAGLLDEDCFYSQLYAADKSFTGALEKWVRNYKALRGFDSELDILMTRLECSREEILTFVSNNPAITTFRAHKIQQTLDTLREVGLSPPTILTFGRLFYHSCERTMTRWGLLCGLGLTEVELAKELLLSERRFRGKYGIQSARGRGRSVA